MTLVPSAIAMSTAPWPTRVMSSGSILVLEGHVQPGVAVVAGLLGEVERGELDARDVAETDGERASAPRWPRGPTTPADAPADGAGVGAVAPVEIVPEAVAEHAPTRTAPTSSRARGAERAKRGDESTRASWRADDRVTASGASGGSSGARTRHGPVSFHPDCHRRLRSGHAHRAPSDLLAPGERHRRRAARGLARGLTPVGPYHRSGIAPCPEDRPDRSTSRTPDPARATSPTATAARRRSATGPDRPRLPTAGRR